MNSPSIRTLMQIKDVTREDAIAIRAIMSGPPKVKGRTRMERIDAILRTCGVESIARGRTTRSPGFVYCNAGDPYAPTVIKIGDRFRVCTWGDIVERGSYD